MALYRQLTHRKVLDELHNELEYYPLDIIDNVLTKDNIKIELERKDRNCMKFRGLLADKVVKLNAKNLFAVLLCCSKAGDIEDLLKHGFTDNDLPLISNETSSGSTDGDSQTLTDDIDVQLRSAKNLAKIWRPPENWDPRDVDDFLKKQWMFLAPVFNTSGDHMKVHHKCPLPFSGLEGIMHRSSIVVYKAVVNSFHQQGFEMDAPKLRIALKEFKDESAFAQEQGNLKRIRGLERYKHITQSLATFEQGVSTKARYYIIFPFAEGGDLTNFWRSKDIRSRTPALALWSLQQMLGIAEALQGLHKDMDTGSNCRHGDLKPGNILHFVTDGQPEGMLKICDFGISRIHNSETIDRKGKPTETRATTPSYEAPEASPILKLQQERSRRYDVWSMGCIYLEFAIWLVEDWEAVQSFTTARASDEKREMLFYQINGKTAKVHPEVIEKMSNLKKFPQCMPGTALGELLDVIQRFLLVVDVQHRIDSTELCTRLRRIVQKAKCEPTYLVGEGIFVG